MKNLPSFCLLVDMLDMGHCSIPYILFKLEEIKKDEAISLREHALKLLKRECALTLFSLLLIKSIGILF